MAIELKASCDLGPDHSGLLFSVIIRVRQVGTTHANRLDRYRVLGVFCAECIESGALAVPRDLIEPLPRSLPSVGGSGGGVAGE